MNSRERLPDAPQVFAAPFDRSQFNDPEVWNQLRDSALRPYHDDDLLSTRLQAEGRAFRRYPELDDEIDQALLADDDASILQAGSLLNYAREEVKPSRETVIGTLVSHSLIVERIADRKNELVGTQAPNARGNAIAVTAGRELVARIPDEQLEEYAMSAEYLLNRIADLQERRGEDHGYMASKLTMIAADIRNRLHSRNYAQLMPGDDIEAASPEQLARDKEYVSGLFSQIHGGRNYGLKLAYTRHEYGGSIVYSPPVTVDPALLAHPNAHHLVSDTPSIATIVHSERTSFRSLKPTPLETGMNTGGFSFDNLGAVTLMSLGPDGELYSDRQCRYALRDIFAGQGKYGAYRRLQAQIIAGYHDLTRPADVVNRITRAERQERESHRPVDRRPLDAINRLVLPRVLYGEAPEEGSGSGTSDGNHSRRQSRRHDVTVHRRKLPEGWHPSPEALELAKQEGISLKPGETVVKAHKRGKKELGEIVGHIVTNGRPTRD